MLYDTTHSEVLLLTTYPSRECGIATYSQDLKNSLHEQFSDSFNVVVAALDESDNNWVYPSEVITRVDLKDRHSLEDLRIFIQNRPTIKALFLQHEFGLYLNKEIELEAFMEQLEIPIVTTFHTVLPSPAEGVATHVKRIVDYSTVVIVMTRASQHILQSVYQIPKAKMKVIPHGTHLVTTIQKEEIKKQKGLANKIVLSTFGLISSGKGIETTLNALPEIIKQHDNIVFLIIGKTHPAVLLHEGERYRNLLQNRIQELGLSEHVCFVNNYLPLDILLEYLQLSDIYLFTSNDPTQAVSGTFSYAVGCGCPVISTRIPHAEEVLRNEGGMLIDFGDSAQLAVYVNQLLNNPETMKSLSNQGKQRTLASSWQNVAIEHAHLLQSIIGNGNPIEYNLPRISMRHIQKLTNTFGMIQFAQTDHPDIASGYTLDDNARGLIVAIKHYELTADEEDLVLMDTYLKFIDYCQQFEGHFLNYINKEQYFSRDNSGCNLDDANGRAIWALGYMISLHEILPEYLVEKAIHIFNAAIPRMESVFSTRAIAFTLKGLWYSGYLGDHEERKRLAFILGTRLEGMYLHEKDSNWIWYERYLTYGNSIIPEGMLFAAKITHHEPFKRVAFETFSFLLRNTFTKTAIRPISNQGWLHKGEIAASFGEQPIDIAYTILALESFYEESKDILYLRKMVTAFQWFLGNNHLHQIVYNPKTSGCFDGLEEHNVNMNQGAESTLSYLLSRLTIEKYRHVIDYDTAVISENSMQEDRILK